MRSAHFRVSLFMALVPEFLNLENEARRLDPIIRLERRVWEPRLTPTSCVTTLKVALTSLQLCPLLINTMENQGSSNSVPVLKSST